MCLKPRFLLSLLGFFSLQISILAAESESTNVPRAARSVHLAWQAPAGDLCYDEMTVEQSVPGSYFMALGWDTGYFGIQEITTTNKVVIFSVWDETKGNDPNAVRAEQRVEVLHQDPDVRIKRFGGEGTGGQCMWPFAWKLGQPYRFCVRAAVDGDKTAYAAFFHLPDEKRWKHLATFRTLTKGSALKGYYSFIEDFRRDTKSAQETRRARFGNGWVTASGGEWVALTRARFTGSSATWESKDNIDGGLASKGFYLATGGEIRAATPLGSIIEQSEHEAKPPEDLPRVDR